MEETYRQILTLATENEQEIIFEDLEEIEKERSYEIYQTPECDTFMLKTPEPVEKEISSIELAKLAEKGRSFDFLSDPGEDIYSITDGESVK